MRRLITAAVLIGGAALPAFGQRGGSHGGSFPGHGAASAGNALSAGTRFSYGASRSVAGRPPGSGLPAFRAGPGSGYRRPVYGGVRRYGYSSLGLPYVYLGGFGYPIGYGSGLGDDYTDASAQPAQSGAAYGDAPAAAYAGLPDTDRALGNDSAAYARPPAQGGANGGGFRPAYVQPRPAPAPPPADEEAVTLIFKDGRSPEQIHNYILSRTIVHVLDGRSHDVPLAQLDLAATVKANKDAGVSFQLPGAVR